jgi:hypothetical protein
MVDRLFNGSSNLSTNRGVHLKLMTQTIALCLFITAPFVMAADQHYYKSDVRPEYSRYSPRAVRPVPVTRQWVADQAARNPHNRYYFHDSRRPSNESSYGRSYVRGRWLDADQIDRHGNEKHVTVKDAGGKTYTRVPNNSGGYDYKSPESMRRYTEQKATEKLFGKPLTPDNYYPGRH